MANTITASIVLCDMDRTSEAVYGFRSWVLQDIREPYEVLLSLFNDRAAVFQQLAADANPMCTVRIQPYPPPSFFNIAAANNLGLAAATGAYVLFANSDILYPPGFLRRVLEELRRRDICYLLGARSNLTPEETSALPAAAHMQAASFEELDGGTSSGGFGSPWTIRRDVARAIGGFDPKVLCHEDSEFNDRAIHYLRRKGLQSFIYAASDMTGYHLHHPPSELYALSEQSRAILEPRRDRLRQDPNSIEDVINNNLDNVDQLLRALYDSVPPKPRLARQHLVGRALRRLRGSVKYLIGGSIR